MKNLKITIFENPAVRFKCESFICLLFISSEYPFHKSDYIFKNLGSFRQPNLHKSVFQEYAVTSLSNFTGKFDKP